jgi:hypothetical protein
MAMHRMQQRQLPLVLLGAGLPILPGLAGESKSDAERLFNFPDVGPLDEADAAKAIREPVEEAGETIVDGALHEICRLTKGYPYFLQEWGDQAWNHADASPIPLEVIRESTAIVTRRLDENFFRVGSRRASVSTFARWPSSEVVPIAPATSRTRWESRSRPWGPCAQT